MGKKGTNLYKCKPAFDSELTAISHMSPVVMKGGQVLELKMEFENTGLIDWPAMRNLVFESIRVESLRKSEFGLVLQDCV